MNLTLEKYLSLIKFNINVWLKNNTILAVLFLICTPIVYSITNTNCQSAARICEIFLAIIGIIIISPIGLPEEKDNVREIVEAKKTNIIEVYIIRTIIGVLTIVVLISICIFMLWILGGIFPYGKFIYGTAVTAFYFGSIGLLLTVLFNQSIIGYLGGVGYVFIEINHKGNYTGFVNVYSLSYGNGSIDSKIYLLLAGIVFIVLALLINRMKQKIR